MTNEELFLTAWDITDFILKKVSTFPNVGINDHRKDGVNSFYDQTEGFLLEEYYETPTILLTPWGRWNFGGGTWSIGRGFQPILEELVSDLGLEVYRPVRINKMGIFGPIHSITKFRNEKLPTPMMIDRVTYKSYEDSKKEWESLCKKFEKPFWNFTCQ